MPYLSLQTNQSTDDATCSELLSSLSSALAEALGKPESYVMVALQTGVPMLFGGSSKPSAYLEVKSIGLPADRTPELSDMLCTLVSEYMGIAANRIYIEFSDAPRQLWGWDGRTF